MQLQVQNKKLV